jgi:hypothetical protein
VQGKTKERWKELCEQATVEQDHDRLMQLVAEIDQLLAEKEQRLRKSAPEKRDQTSSK